MAEPRRICVVLVDRANYGRLKPVMVAIREQAGLELMVMCGGSMVLERFDRPVEVVRKDGFRIDAEVYMELEGSTPATMAKSVGFGVVEFASELQRLKPEFVLLIGDRYEARARNPHREIAGVHAPETAQPDQPDVQFRSACSVRHVISCVRVPEAGGQYTPLVATTVKMRP